MMVKVRVHCIVYNVYFSAFTYSVRDFRLWIALACAVISCVVLVVTIATNQIKQVLSRSARVILGTLFEQAYFLISVVALIVSLGMLIAFKDRKTYILDQEAKMYTFKSGNKVIIRSGFHNVYIRLRKKRGLLPSFARSNVLQHAMRCSTI